MQSPVGTWAVFVATPIGKQHVILRVVEQAGGLGGTATRGTETVPLIDMKCEEDRLTWTQSVTKPMRLTLKFDVTFDETRMIGTAKAGVLPSSRLEGVRERA